MRSFSTHFARHLPHDSPLPSLAAEARRLDRFVPPFRFTTFFAPEDTLLCAIAAEAALRGPLGRTGAPTTDDVRDVHIVELTTGSGLVGLRLLDLEPRATLFGVDIDHGAPRVARANATRLGLDARARFERASIWEEVLERRLRNERIDLLVCNPPYIPEPPGGPLPLEAGAGADGAAHVRRVIELADALRPTALALSWCSLSDPAGVVAAAERAGYRLDSLHAVVIGDGEYSGVVHRYLRTLPTAFLSEDPDVVAEIAPDGAARFAYVLLAGVFVDGRAPLARGRRRPWAGDAAHVVDRLVRDFVRHGTAALAAAAVPFPLAAWVLDRWDEIALRAFLHGALDQGSLAGGPARGAPRAGPPAPRAG